MFDQAELKSGKWYTFVIEGDVEESVETGLIKEMRNILKTSLLGGHIIVAKSVGQAAGGGGSHFKCLYGKKPGKGPMLVRDCDRLLNWDGPSVPPPHSLGKIDKKRFKFILMMRALGLRVVLRPCEGDPPPPNEVPEPEPLPLDDDSWDFLDR